MKYLILIIVLFLSCTDKKQITETIVIEPEPIKLSYDNDLDLILIDTDGGKNITYQFLPKKDENYREYQAIYWDQRTLNYYHASIEKYTNKILYALDSNQQQESLLIENYKEFVINDIPLLYAGSISPLERVYINPEDNSSYLKTLTLLDDSFYITDDKLITNQNIDPVFPIVYRLEGEFIDNPGYYTVYTNSNIYGRYTRHKGQLMIVKEKLSVNQYLLDAASYFIVTMLYPEVKYEFSE